MYVKNPINCCSC